MESSQSKENLASKMGDRDTNNLSLILVVIALLVAVIALIIASVGISQKGTYNFQISTSGDGGTPASQTGPTPAPQAGSRTGGGSGSGSSSDSRVWTFAIGDGEFREAYIDQTTGTLQGFLVDLVNAVCKVADKNCRIMGDLWARCWDTKAGEAARGGEGLMGFWYDACPGWVGTFDRHRTYTFTDPYGKGAVEKLYVNKGSGATFGTDLTGKSVGILDGYSTDEHCLARQNGITGVPLSMDQIVHYPNPSDLKTALQNGDVDVGFAPKNLYSSMDDLDEIPNVDVQCFSSGPGLMARVDSDLPAWWNPAQERLLTSQMYAKICQDLTEEHGHMPGRDPSELCFP